MRRSRDCARRGFCRYCAAASAPASEAQPASPAGAKSVSHDPAQFSPQEVALLQSLAQRRGELDKRSSEIDQREAVRELVSQPDLLEHVNHPRIVEPQFSKDQLHYLLRNKSVFDVPPTVLENIARIDGAVVVCLDANLLAFGAILHHHSEPEALNRTVEGGRTTAAIAASHYGTVLKISEDGLISMYRGGRCLWEM